MKQRLQHLIVNTCTTLAYIVLIFEWVLASLPFLPSIIAIVPRRTVDRVYTQPAVQTTVEQTFPGWAIGLIVAIIIALAAVVVIRTLSHAPRAIGDTGQKITKSGAHIVLPIVTRRRKVSLRTRKKLTWRIMFYIKLAALIVPVIVVMVLPFPDSARVGHSAMIIVTSLMAGWTALLFAAESIAMKKFHMSFD